MKYRIIAPLVFILGALALWAVFGAEESSQPVQPQSSASQPQDETFSNFKIP